MKINLNIKKIKNKSIVTNNIILIKQKKARLNIQFRFKTSFSYIQFQINTPFLLICTNYYKFVRMLCVYYF